MPQTITHSLQQMWSFQIQKWIYLEDRTIKGPKDVLPGAAADAIFGAPLGLPGYWKWLSAG